MHARLHLLAGAAVILLAMPAAALAQAEYSRYPPIPGLIDEVKAGTLSQENYDKLVKIRDDGADRLTASFKREIQRGTLTKDAIRTMMANMSGELTDSVKAGDANAVVDASLNGVHAISTQLVLPALADAGLLLDDMHDVMRQVYKARADMPGANQGAVTKVLHQLDLSQAAVDASLYVVGKKIDASDTALQNLPPEKRAELVTKTQGALANGAIKIGADGKVAISPALMQAAGFTTAGASSNASSAGGTSGQKPLANANGGNGNNVNSGGAAPGYDTGNPFGKNGSSPTGYDTGAVKPHGGVAMSAPPARAEILKDVYNSQTGATVSTTSIQWIKDIKTGQYVQNPQYSAALDAQADADYKAQLAYWKLTGKWDWDITDGGGGGGDAGGGEGGAVGGGNGTLYLPQGSDYATISSNGYGSVALDAIYGTTQVIFGDGWSNTASVPSTQVAGPSSVLNSPDTHPQGPSSAMSGPSSGGVTGPSSAGLTGPSSGGLVGPSSAMTGPSSAMTAPSIQVTGPSSAMTSPETQMNGPSDALGNPDALSNVGNDDQPSLCGR